MEDNNSRLVVGALGHGHAGKSTTWYRLFGRTRRTGWKWLPVSETEQVLVFLVNGSPEERHVDIEDIIPEETPAIVLCSFRYQPGVENTIRYFRDRGYYFYGQWLNPGHSDRGPYQDTLGLIPMIAGSPDQGQVHVRDGRIDPTARVEEMRSFIREWAAARGLLRRRPALV